MLKVFMAFFGGCLSVLTATGLNAQTGDAAVRPLKVAPVTVIAADIVRRYSAVIEPSQQVEMSFRVSGRLVELPILAAMDVAKDDVIAKLDPRDFEANVAQLQSQIDQADAQLAALRIGARPEEISALEASVEAAQAQLDQAQVAVVRTRRLATSNAATPAALEGAEANLRIAQAGLRGSQNELALGQSGGRPEEIAASEAALRGLRSQLATAQDNLDDTILRAPFTGIIARRHVENFTNIQAGSEIALLQSLAKVDLAFDVPAADVVSLTQNGDPHTVADIPNFGIEGLDAEFMEFSVDAQQGSQTYRAVVRVTVPENLRVLPGMVGNVTVTAAGNGGRRLVVPYGAVAADSSGGTFVWKVDMDTNMVSQAPVTLGEALSEGVVAIDGVSADDTLAVAGVSSLQDGMTVRPVAKIGE